MKYLLFIILIAFAGCTSIMSDNERYDACISLMNSAYKNLQAIDSAHRQFGTGAEKLNEELDSIHNILETVERSINEVGDDNMRKTLKAQYADLVAKDAQLVTVIKE